MVKYFNGVSVESWLKKNNTNKGTEVLQVSTRFKLNVYVFNGVRGVSQTTTNIYTVLPLFKSHTFNRKSWNCGYLKF